jgi:hypothetical protein
LYIKIIIEYNVKPLHAYETDLSKVNLNSSRKDFSSFKSRTEFFKKDSCKKISTLSKVDLNSSRKVFSSSKSRTELFEKDPSSIKSGRAQTFFEQFRSILQERFELFQK